MNLAKYLTGFYLVLSFTAMLGGASYLALTLPDFFPTALLTYPFVSLSGIIDTAFGAFFLWLTLSTLLMRLSNKQLTLLFFTATLFIGSVMGSLSWLTGSSFVLAGTTPLIYCLLITLIRSDPHLKMAILGLLPVQPKVIIYILLGINTIHYLSVGAYWQILANGAGVLYAFLFTPLLKKAAHKLR